MHLRKLWWGLLACCLWMVATFSVAGESLTELVPPGAVVTAELTDAASTIAGLKTSDALRTLTESELYKTWAQSPDGRKARGGRAVLEGQLGMNLWDAAERLIGRNVLLAVYLPHEGDQPDSVLIIRFAQENTAGIIREKLTPWIEIAGGAVRAEERDGTWFVETADDKAFGCLRGDYLVLANRHALRQTVLELLEKSSDPATTDAAAKEDGDSSRDAAGPQLTVHWNSQPLRAKLGGDFEQRLLPAKVDNPLGSLLIGGLLEVVSRAPEVQGQLKLDPSGLTATVQAKVAQAQIDAAHQTLLVATQSPNDVIPAVPRQLATVSLCRDWASWYRQREALIEEHVLPEFDKFETGLSNLLPGKDFCEDVLTLLNSPITIVSAEQTYPHLDGRPGMQLPAFAVVLDLTNAERGADIFQLFFQTLGTVVNIEAGKSGRQPWVMHSLAHQDVQINYAKYLDRPQGEDLPLVFNFQPAAALVGQKYVAATSLELCEDLIDVLKQPVGQNPAEVEPQNFRLTLNPDTAVQLLEANRAIITARRIQSGISSEQANTELDAVLNWVSCLTPFSLTTDVTSETVELRLQGGWK